MKEFARHYGETINTPKGEGLFIGICSNQLDIYAKVDGKTHMFLLSEVSPVNVEA